MADTFYNAYGQEIELTGEQSACLKYTGGRTLMVKGFAGAGKSIVLMALAAKFKQAYGAHAGNKVAILTYQNTLVSTTKEILLENEEQDSIIVRTVNSYISDLYKRMTEAGLAPKKKIPFNDQVRIKNIEAALKQHQNQHGKHRFHDLDLKFWLDEIDWMKDMNVADDDLNYYLSIPRTGRGGKVRMRSADRVVAYQIYLTYMNYMDKTNQADWADQTLFIVRHRNQIPEDMKFEHILIDEAQDLSLAQMTAILGLYTKDMTVAMDMNQRVHSKYWTPKLLGIETTTKKLTKSMRTTKQIDNLAESIRRHNDVMLSEDDKSLRAIPEREGPLPRLVHLNNDAEQKKYVTRLVRAYLDKNDKITIGIIASKNKHIEQMISPWLTEAGIKHEIISKDSTFSMKAPGVKLATAHSAKGLEFNVVIIPNFAQGYFPYGYKPADPEEMNNYLMKMRNLVYVSMTRAKSQLFITYWGKLGSQFIGEMDPTMYELDGGPVEGTYVVPEPVTMLTTELPVFGARDKSDKNNSDNSQTVSLVEYLKSKKDITVNDKRDKGGALWISGTKDVLEPVMKETKKIFGAFWLYSEKKSAYFTKCRK